MESPLQSALLLSGIIQVILIIFVLVRNQLNRYSLPLIFFSFVNCLGIAAIHIEIHSQAQLWTLGYYLLFAYLALIPFSWLLLCSRWGLDAKEFPRARKLVSWAFFGIAILLFAGFTIMREIDLAMVNNRWFVILGEWRYWYCAYFVTCLTAGIYFIETCYRSALGLSREKLKKSFFLLIAAGICFLAITTVGFLYGQISDWIFIFAFVLLTIVSLMLVRHYIVFDPEISGIILTKRGIYSSLAIVIFGTYFLLIGSIGEFLLSFELDENLFFTIVILSLIIVTLAIMLFSQMYKVRSKSITEDTSPYNEDSVYGVEWKEFAEEISILMGIENIYSRTAHLLHRLLKIEDCFFIIKEPDPSPNFTLYKDSDKNLGVPGSQVTDLCEWLQRYSRPIEIPTLKEMAEAEHKQFEDIASHISFETFVLVPLSARQQFLGFWGVGKHSTGRELISDEIAFIEAAASPLALTILGARITDELVVSKEIESYHRFSSFVLHDLKNSVGMLSMLLQNAGQNMDDPEFQREALVTIKKAVERQKKIISRLTEQGTGDKLAVQRAEIKKLIEDALNRIRFDTITKIELKTDIDSNQAVLVDIEKIGSVIDNLLMNAVEAMPEGGTLTVSSVATIDPKFKGIQFSDTGEGMNQEFIATRLFKPFSSTKKLGLGIGMYQSREIIIQHNGKLDVTSESSRGTDITIYLPAAE